MKQDYPAISIVGGGLAGSEAAWQLAEMGFHVKLHEMRPERNTPAHKTAHLAELVCSNSFGSVAHHAVTGQLKWEAERLGSLILESAGLARVPAGQALGIDRELFARRVTERINSHPRIVRLNGEVSDVNQVPRPTILATGPLTSEPLSTSLLKHFDQNFLYFFDAIAPIIDADTIDMNIAWVADRYDKGSGDYINCPMTKEQYELFIAEIEKAEKSEAKEFEKDTPYFEGCMPIEEMIRRGPQTLRFGPLSPKGLTNKNNGEKAYAVVQLRKENKEGTSYNLVGFQTKLKYFEQKRIFRLIPGLENAEFLKLGSIHRNLFINSSLLLNPNLSSRQDPQLFFAGQITGVEGYFESTCIGLLSARFMAAHLRQEKFTPPPRETALGALLYGLLGEEKNSVQPININLGLFPPLAKKMGKREKREQMVLRARQAFNQWFIDHEIKAPLTERFIEQMANQLRGDGDDE